MMRAEAAPRVPDSIRSARISAISIDRRRRQFAQRALVSDEARQELAQLVDARGVGRRLPLRLLGLGAEHEGVGLLGVGPRARTSSDTQTRQRALITMPTTKPWPTGSSSASGAGR